MIVGNLSKFNISSFFATYHYGISYSIILNSDVITFEPKDSLIMSFNESLEYMVLLSDPNFQLFSTNPGTAPHNLINLRSGTYMVYLKVTRGEIFGVKLVDINIEMTTEIEMLLGNLVTDYM